MQAQGHSYLSCKFITFATFVTNLTNLTIVTMLNYVCIKKNGENKPRVISKAALKEIQSGDKNLASEIEVLYDCDRNGKANSTFVEESKPSKKRNVMKIDLNPKP